MLTGVVARAVTLKEKRRTRMVNTMGLLLQEQRWSVSKTTMIIFLVRMLF